MNNETKKIDGMKFNRLLVIERVANKGSSVIYKCLCDCGNYTFVEKYRIVHNITKSCGCLCREITAKRSTVHGMFGTPEYTAWWNMVDRCRNKKHAAYKNYGGRGITVDPLWEKSFVNFYTDMGNRPEGCTLERIDNSKGYSKENCKWATWVHQAANKRMSSRNKTGITGVKKSGKKWSAYICRNYKNIHLGSFDNLFDACCARKSAENIYT